MTKAKKPRKPKARGRGRPKGPHGPHAGSTAEAILMAVRGELMARQDGTPWPAETYAQAVSLAEGHLGRTISRACRSKAKRHLTPEETARLFGESNAK